MPWKKPSSVELSEKQRLILTQLEKGTHTPMHLKSRATIIVMSDRGLSNNHIEKSLGISGEKVTHWRDKFNKSMTELNRIEKESPQKLRSAITEILSDAKRIGAPPKFSDEQVAAIIAMSCEDIGKFDLPFSNWTPVLLRIEVIKLGIVKDISVRQVGRFLKRI